MRWMPKLQLTEPCQRGCTIMARLGCCSIFIWRILYNYTLSPLQPKELSWSLILPSPSSSVSIAGLFSSTSMFSRSGTSLALVTWPCTCMYVCMYLYMYVYVFIYDVFIYEYVCTYVFVCVFICASLCASGTCNFSSTVGTFIAGILEEHFFMLMAQFMSTYLFVWVHM